jgi:hypothetical protein
MKYSLLAIALVSTSAFATGTKPVTYNKAESNAVAAAYAKAALSSQTNTSVVTTMDHQQIPVSTAYAPSIQATAPCALPLSGGVQFMNIGASAGSAYILKTCEDREAQRIDVETARGLAAMGMQSAAKELVCANATLRDKLSMCKE